MTGVNVNKGSRLSEGTEGSPSSKERRSTACRILMSVSESKWRRRNLTQLAIYSVVAISKFGGELTCFTVELSRSKCTLRQSASSGGTGTHTSITISVRKAGFPHASDRALTLVMQTGARCA